MRAFFPLLSLLTLLRPGPGTGPVPLRPTFAAPALTPLTLPGELYFGQPNLYARRETAHRVVLSWNAIPELYTQGYTVQRSLDGLTWQRLGYLPGSPLHRYRFEDSCAEAACYRVVRLDLNRRSTASAARPVPPGRARGPLLAEPNPAHGPVHLLGRDPFQPVDVLNSRGQLVDQISAASFSTRGLEPGVYALRQGSQVTRLIVR